MQTLKDLKADFSHVLILLLLIIVSFVMIYNTKITWFCEKAFVI